MSGRPWDAAAAAKALDARMAADLDNMELPAPHECFREIRSYLQRQTDTGRTRNGARLLSQRALDNGDTQLDAGPTVFREPCDTCVQFWSGAQLSFGITLRTDGHKSKLLSYRFHLQLLPTSGLRFVRIDLNPPKKDNDPLRMPRSHLHPGFEGVHIPFPVMRPLEVLDRICLVIEPCFAP